VAKPNPKQLLVRWITVLGLALTLIIGVFWLGTSFLSFIQQRFTETAPTSTPSITKAPNESTKPDTTLTRCKDEDIAVSISIDKNTPAISEQDFVIRVSFSYTGSGNCVRDMGAKANEVWIENSEGIKIWSTDTCPAHNKSNLVEPQFADVYQMVVTWPGTEDAVECGKRGRGVEPGEYNILARNGLSTSKAISISATES
jgi:hypothetical protein